MPLTASEEIELLQRFKAEQEEHREFPFRFELGLPVVSTLIAQLQLASRHPHNVGPSRAMMQEVIVGLIERMHEAGFSASAQVAALGQSESNDVTGS